VNKFVEFLLYVNVGSPDESTNIMELTSLDEDDLSDEAIANLVILDFHPYFDFGHISSIMPPLLLLLFLFTHVHCFSSSPYKNPSSSLILPINRRVNLHSRKLSSFSEDPASSGAEVLDVNVYSPNPPSSIVSLIPLQSANVLDDVCRGGGQLGGQLNEMNEMNEMKGNSFWPRGDKLDKSILLVSFIWRVMASDRVIE
jgi:hypothetical protein